VRRRGSSSSSSSSSSSNSSSTPLTPPLPPSLPPLLPSIFYVILGHTFSYLAEIFIFEDYREVAIGVDGNLGK